MSPAAKTWVARGVTVALGLGIWFWPVPEGLTPQAWHLFALFAATIFSVIVGAFPILTASVLAVAVCVLSGILRPRRPTRVRERHDPPDRRRLPRRARHREVRPRQRLGHLVVSLFGRSTLGLGYSIFFLDAVIAPAFPSDTARSGVLYPLSFRSPKAAGSKPDEATRKRIGAFLMFCGIATLSLSSALWLTAMAGNPLGAEIGKALGLKVSFGSWLVASFVPTLVCLAVLPYVIYKVFPPEVKATPEAPAAAKKALAAMGPLSRAREDRRRRPSSAWSTCGRRRDAQGRPRPPSRSSAWASSSPRAS